MIPVNYLAVLVAGVANFILGWLWFGPIFGKVWMGTMGMTMEKVEVMKAEGKMKGMWKNYLLTFVGSLLMAFTLFHVITFGSAYLHITGVSAGLQGALWNWIGFVLPVTIGVVLWDGKSWKYWAITYVYYLVGLLMMGAIIGAWM